MIKKLKQVLQPNPSVPYIKPGKEKEFAGTHKVLKTNDAAGNDDKVFKGSTKGCTTSRWGNHPNRHPRIPMAKEEYHIRFHLIIAKRSMVVTTRKLN